jgi:hypothetical protein
MVSVRGPLVSVIWACSEVEHHGREHVAKQRCSPHGSQEAKGAGVLLSQGHAPKDLTSLH